MWFFLISFHPVEYSQARSINASLPCQRFTLRSFINAAQLPARKRKSLVPDTICVSPVYLEPGNQRMTTVLLEDAHKHTHTLHIPYPIWLARKILKMNRSTYLQPSHPTIITWVCAVQKIREELTSLLPSLLCCTASTSDRRFAVGNGFTRGIGKKTNPHSVITRK